MINGYWERADFPWPLIEKMSPLGIVGDGIEGYGCPPMDPLSAELINMEINRGDGSLGTFLAVQAGLAMKAIAKCGSEEHMQRWLGPMARLEKIGAFALTEPGHGSDSVSLETTARPDGESYVINGNKKWIGNGSIADVTAMQLYCIQIAKLDAAGKLAPTLAGLAKLHNTSKACGVLADARDMLGGNRILLDFHIIRHMADIESIHTFEGTETIQTLIVGRDITGIGAFS